MINFSLLFLYDCISGTAPSSDAHVCAFTQFLWFKRLMAECGSECRSCHLTVSKLQKSITCLEKQKTSSSWNFPLSPRNTSPSCAPLVAETGTWPDDLTAPVHRWTTIPLLRGVSQSTQSLSQLLRILGCSYGQNSEQQPTPLPAMAH